MFLISRGHVRGAGTLMAFIQSSIVLLSGLTRTPETTAMTVQLFSYPTIFLATVFSSQWVHAPIMLYLVGVTFFNYLRYNPAASVITPEAMQGLMTHNMISFTITLLLIYVLSLVTTRSLRLALKISNEETRKSNEKNDYIMQILSSIRKSYNELTGAMDKTDNAISSIVENIQTEAATIEELVASIEEISSSTTSIEQISRDQNESVSELSTSINSLSELIDSLHQFG
ncbi:MAG: hypothetical protein ACRCUT_05570, partial [Spirochaetota bacterium]